MITNTILHELSTLFAKTAVENYERTLRAYERSVRDAHTFIGIGAGRMGYSLRGHIMRLSHLGIDSYMIGDTSLPRISESSTVLISSSSGETPTNVLYAQQAAAAGSKIISFTCNAESTVAKLSDVVFIIPTIASAQLMKSIYEQYTLLLFDSISHDLCASLDLAVSAVERNHSILE